MRLLVLTFGLALGAIAQQMTDDVPANLHPPADEKLIQRVHGTGDQIYSCTNTGSSPAWTLKAPDALLTSPQNQILGRHYAGPTWEFMDRSSVVGKVASSAPAPGGDSIPWLLLTVVRHNGDGALSGVTSIQRLNTKGGKAPATGCDAGHLASEQRVHYEADYLFYGKVK